MTNCPLCNIDLDVDDIELKSHLSDRHGNRIEVAKALANILTRLGQIEAIFFACILKRRFRPYIDRNV
jgi:hypothetical protein